MHHTDTDNTHHDHRTSNIAGYLVTRTDWNDGPVTRTVQAEVDGATNYSHALDLVRALRATANAKQYAVAETVYSCGCDTGTLYV